VAAVTCKIPENYRLSQKRNIFAHEMHSTIPDHTIILVLACRKSIHLWRHEWKTIFTFSFPETFDD